MVSSHQRQVPLLFRVEWEARGGIEHRTAVVCLQRKLEVRSRGHMNLELERESHTSKVCAAHVKNLLMKRAHPHRAVGMQYGQG